MSRDELIETLARGTHQLWQSAEVGAGNRIIEVDYEGLDDDAKEHCRKLAASLLPDIVEFVSHWITENDGPLTAQFWREEMGE